MAFKNINFNSLLSGSRQKHFPGLTYMEGDTVLHRSHPLLKLLSLVCFNILVFWSVEVKGSILLFLLLLITYWRAGLGMMFFWRKLRFILLFSIMILIVQILWVREGFLLWEIRFGGLKLPIWSGGFWGGLQIVFRFINIIGSSYLFVAITNPNKLAYALMQAGLPYRAGFMLITALRFIPLFHMELAQIRNAQLAKGIDLEGISPKKLIKSVKYLLVPLVISTLGKVDTLTVSMEIRAFGQHKERTYMDAQKLSFTDGAKMLVVSVMTFILMVRFRRL